MRAPVSATLSEAEAALDRAVQELKTVLGPAVYSDDGRNLEVVVGDLLRDKHLTVAVAESCTGGGWGAAGGISWGALMPSPGRSG